MKTSYIVRPKNWLSPSFTDDGIEPQRQPTSLVVWEAETSTRKTGLLDQYGNDLYAIDALEKIGFVNRR